MKIPFKAEDILAIQKKLAGQASETEVLKAEPVEEEKKEVEKAEEVEAQEDKDKKKKEGEEVEKAEATEEVEKAAEPEVKEEKEVQKSISLTEDELGVLIANSVEAGTRLAVQQFSGHLTELTTQLSGLSQTVQTLAGDVETFKSISVTLDETANRVSATLQEVKALGDRPQPRKGLITEETVEKSNTVAKTIDWKPFDKWSIDNLEMTQSSLLRKLITAGEIDQAINYGLDEDVAKSMGVK